MRITKITAEKVSVPLTEPFVISLGVIDTADTVFVRVETDAGLTGYGEGAGIGFVTGETPDTVLGAITAFEPLLLGASPYAIEHLHCEMDAMLVRNGSAKAAIDLALYDLMAKGADLPLYRFLGGVNGVIETDMTIGLGTVSAMAAKAKSLVSSGYREIKVKAGSDEELDRAAIIAIREVAPLAALKVDANQGWSVSQALRMLAHYADVGVGAIEQPLPYWDLDGMAELTRRSPIPIMADESCFIPQDAAKIVARRAADVINIKLMKCGGIYRALQINAIAEAAGVRTMLGCMLESRLAITAGAHMVASRRNFQYADLDSFADFDDAALITRAFDLHIPDIHLPERPGTGVDLAW